LQNIQGCSGLKGSKYINGYDIIGDVHGHASVLKTLLEKLGYSLDGEKYPEGRKIIFLGDFIDRGFENKGTVEIVKSLMKRGKALSVMGNHEYNAICYHNKHPETGKPLRKHSIKNIKQHEQFLAEYQNPIEIQEVINWFKTLPLFIERDGIRVVHACWHQEYIDEIKPLLATGNIITEKLLLASQDKNSLEHKAIDTILKGPEYELPEGLSFRDQGKAIRTAMRIKWWGKNNGTYKDAAVSVPDGAGIPDQPLLQNIRTYPENEIPVFFGHYWMTDGDETVCSNAACIDYSIAKGGKLACYRWNENDAGRPLSSGRVVSVS
jgi:hypothetical protein